MKKSILLLDNSRILITQLFLRGLGICYLLEWINLTPQILRIWGSEGIVPISKVVNSGFTLEKFFSAPSLFWFLHGDASLLLCGCVAVLLALLIVGGYTSGLILALLWVIQLSFSTLGFGAGLQAWDRLLLEVGFLAIFVFVGDKEKNTVRPIHFLLQLVLFRLLIQSGLEKFPRPFDESWSDLTFIKKFWFTLPTPNVFTWVLYQFPPVFHQVATYFTFFVEVVVPPLMFGPLLLRRCFFILVCLFQFLIFFTSNFEIFNLLTSILCLLVFRDCELPDRLRRWVSQLLESKLLPEFGDRGLNIGSKIAPALIVAIFLFPAHVSHLYASVTKPAPMMSDQWVYLPGASEGAFVEAGYSKYLQMISRYHLVNAFGIFGSLPNERIRSFVEWSADLISWEPFDSGFESVGSSLSWPTYFFVNRINSEMWNAAIGVNFIGVQRHHKLYEGREPFDRHFFKWLLAKKPGYLRVSSMSCKYTSWKQFVWAKKNWWTCQPTNRQEIFSFSSRID